MILFCLVSFLGYVCILHFQVNFKAILTISIKQLIFGKYNVESTDKRGEHKYVHNILLSHSIYSSSPIN
jgi:hypothetical protein